LHHHLLYLFVEHNASPWDREGNASLYRQSNKLKYDIQRAQQISKAFSHVSEISVKKLPGGLLVHHHGKVCYFVREACFWPFAFKVAGSAENAVSDIEVHLAA